MPHMKKPASRICTVALLLAAVPQGAWAQEEDSVQQTLPDVIVTAPKRVRADQFYTVDEMSSATGMKLAPKDTPQSVSVVTRKAMDDRGADFAGKRGEDGHGHQCVPSGLPNALPIARV